LKQLRFAHFSSAAVSRFVQRFLRLAEACISASGASKSSSLAADGVSANSSVVVTEDDGRSTSFSYGGTIVADVQIDKIERKTKLVIIAKNDTANYKKSQYRLN